LIGLNSGAHFQHYKDRFEQRRFVALQTFLAERKITSFNPIKLDCPTIGCSRFDRLAKQRRYRGRQRGERLRARRSGEGIFPPCSRSSRQWGTLLAMCRGGVQALPSAFRNMADHSMDGAIHFLCMDWHHMNEMLAAGQVVYSELKNLIVWAKDNGGMGTFYRSRHELIFAFKIGTGPHVNSFKLGQHGRYRTNVWQYKGVNTMRAGRMDELAMHPTVKPVQMIADAIKDVSGRGEIVLDLFGGSGSTLIAAEKTGRRARLVELDQVYCDRILARWETWAKDHAEQLLCGWAPTRAEQVEAAE
jgi:hypothetical protein